MIPLPDKKYNIIYADPAWSYRDKASAGKRGACFKYPTVTQDWLNKFNSPLNLHIYTSRQLWNDKTIQSEEDEFGRVIQDNINDRKKINLLVKEYWSKH